MGDLDIHWLREHAQLEAVLQRLGKELLHRDIQIHGEAHTAHGMDHADAVGSHVIDGVHHVAEKFYQRERAGDVVGEFEEGLLVHFPCIRVVATQVFDLLPHLVEQLRIHNAGVAVIFHHHDFLVRAYGVQFFPADEPSLPYGIRRCAKADQGIPFCLASKLPNHFRNLGIRLRIHHIQPGLEGRKRRKVLMRVDKGRDQRATAKLDSLSMFILFRQCVSHIQDLSLVLDKIGKHIVVRVNG